VAWSRWEGFAASEPGNRPVLVFLYSVRSFWCRDIAERCFGDAEVAAAVSAGTVPVWVDVDRRPDLAERYGMGGWPSLSFLTPEGDWITGTTYVDPDDFLRLLGRVRLYFDVPERREDLERQRTRLEARAGRERRRPPEPPTRRLAGELADSVLSALARGEEVGPASLEMLLDYASLSGERGHGTSAVEAVEATLTGGECNVDGLLCRGALTADGALIDPEKPLARNVGMLAVAAIAAEQERDAGLRESAISLGDAILSRLRIRDDSLFCAGLTGFSGHVDSAGAPTRFAWLAGARAPYADTTLYSGANALATSAFVALQRATGDARFAVASRRVLSGIRERFWSDRGVEHCTGQADGAPLLLVDQALVARAALDLHELEGRPGDLTWARRLADLMLSEYAPHTGGLRDRAPEVGEDHTSAVDRLLPSGNGVAAQVFLRLAARGEGKAYGRAGERIVEALVGPNLHRGAHLGALGRALTLWAYGRPTGP